MKKNHPHIGIENWEYLDRFSFVSITLSYHNCFLHLIELIRTKESTTSVLLEGRYRTTLDRRNLITFEKTSSPERSFLSGVKLHSFIFGKQCSWVFTHLNWTRALIDRKRGNYFFLKILRKPGVFVARARTKQQLFQTIKTGFLSKSKRRP